MAQVVAQGPRAGLGCANAGRQHHNEYERYVAIVHIPRGGAIPLSLLANAQGLSRPWQDLAVPWLPNG